MSVTIYGIKNCDTVKKARAWLTDRDIVHNFHDCKTAGVDCATISGWVDEFGWEKVLNRAGTTFRKLPEAETRDLDRAKAIALMMAQPSLIKRPVLDLGTKRVLGFKPEIYAAAFGR